MSDDVVRARGVRKAYRDVVALDDVDVVVEAGTVHGLVGPNGAGKTTLLGLVVGLDVPDAGHLAVLGEPAARRTPDGVGGCAETPRFYPHLTAAENLRLLARLDRLGTRRAINDGVAERLDRVGLAGVAGVRVRDLSLGMRQRLAIAAALLRNLRLLVLDEPVNGLDPAGVAEMRTLVRGLAAEGVTVLMSSHHILEVEATCDAVTILRAGRVAFAGTLAEMRARAPRQAYRLRTSDDVAALAAAGAHRTLDVHATANGLVLGVDAADLDVVVLDLAARGIAVRELRPLATPLEALFAELTGTPPAVVA